MTPIKSLVMIKRSLEKAFMCKWDEPAIYFRVRRGRGLAETEKKNYAQEKKEKRLVHKEA